MRRHSFVVTVATGALLLGACKSDEPITRNPPMPEPVPMPDPSLPTWDQVASGHPPGATNPPIPHLVVKPDGTCYKLWTSPMMRPEPGKIGDYVDPNCAGDDCGTPIQCPDRAAEVLAAWKAGEAPGEK
jgi:hypothetical protein